MGWWKWHGLRMETISEKQDKGGSRRSELEADGSSHVLNLSKREAYDAPDGWVRVVYTHHVIRRVIEICGLIDLLPQYTTLDAALRNAPTRHLDEEPSA